MSEVIVDKLEIVGAPRAGQKISVRAVIQWPVDGDDASLLVHTKKKTGEIVNTHEDEATGEIISIELPALTSPGTYFIEIHGAHPVTTTTFEITPIIKPPEVGARPIT